jgi:HEAT repeat protein
MRTVLVLLIAALAAVACERQRDPVEPARGERTARWSSSDNAFIRALEDGDPEVRRNAAEALGKTRDVAAADALVDALHDRDIYARKAAAEALGLVLERAPDAPGRDAAAEALIALLRDADYGVRYNTTDALSRLRDSRAVTPLLAVLRSDKDTLVRGHAAWALGQIGDPAATGPLIAALSEEDNQWKVSYALGAIDNEEASRVLMRGLRARKFGMVSGAADFFVRHHEPSTDALLLDMLAATRDLAVAQALVAHPSPRVAEEARRFLGLLDLTVVDDGHGQATLATPRP